MRPSSLAPPMPGFGEAPERATGGSGKGDCVEEGSAGVRPVNPRWLPAEVLRVPALDHVPLQVSRTPPLGV